MKICYLISNLSQGRGGHFYSLRTTARALRERCRVFVVDVGGAAPSPVLQESGLPFHHICCDGLNVGPVFVQLIRILRQEAPDVLHAFDPTSHFFARVAALVIRRPVLLTKCGGPNPRTYYPYAETLVAYSQENLRYFETRNKFRSTTIHLIPNRVSAISQDPPRLHRLVSRLNLSGDCPTLLRIATLSAFHRESLLQSIRLAKRLNRDGHRCQLVVIGVRQDTAVVQEIEQLCDDTIRLVTEDEYTLNAAALIDLADMVVGTGRSLMEAAARGKVLLAPLAGHAYPVLVTPAILSQLFYYNFSTRAAIDGVSEEENIGAIVRLMLDSQLQSAMRQQAAEWYHKYFAIETVVEQYHTLYRAAVRNHRHHPLDLTLHAAWYVRGLLHRYWLSRT